MKKKLNCILLIDDDEATNFLHTLVIEEADIANDIIAVQSGQAAIEFLTSRVSGEYPKPELIFLDINMPGMNGWEFLDAYENLSKEVKNGSVILIMLTTSLNPDDEIKAHDRGFVNSFLNKPLTVSALNQIIQEYIPEFNSPGSHQS
jgi:CheY-like chemotaxis protein